MISDDELTVIEARADGASWYPDIRDLCAEVRRLREELAAAESVAEERRERAKSAELENERLTAKLATAEKALERYADEEAWDSCGALWENDADGEYTDADCGHAARTALVAIRGEP